MPDTPSGPWGHAGREHSVHDVFPAVAEGVGVARRSVSRWLRTMAVDDRVIGKVAIAVSEACTNAVVHGYRDRVTPGCFEVAAHRIGRELFIRVADDGCGTSAWPDGAGLGRGLPLIEALTSHLDVRAADDGGGTVVKMTFDAGLPTDIHSHVLGDTGPPAAVTQASGQCALANAETPPPPSIEDELAALDSEQRQSDADQASSDADQLRADKDQTAANREQRTSDLDPERGRGDTSSQARSRELRRGASRQRRRTAHVRRRTSDQRAASSRARAAARAAMQATLGNDTGAWLRARRVALSDDALLAAVTDEVVALHLRYYHRVPTTAKTQLLGGDLLACTLGGIYTDVEKTMIELQHADVVKSTRQTFETAVQGKFIEAVERLSGRDVRSFVSHHHVGPDLAVELFMLEPEVKHT